MDAIYQHFREEEYSFIDQMLQLVLQVEDEYTPKLTFFLDPRQCYILETIIGSYETLQVTFFGGSTGTERVRALVYPDYFVPSDADFAITLFHIRYPAKFTTLTHQKILGTLMSLGIKREIFGDIITDGITWQVFVQTEMKDYIALQLEKIGKVHVMLEEIPLTNAIMTNVEWEEQMITASSMRLDVIAANSHHISRQKAKQLVQAGLVKANWQTIENPDFECEEEDVISVRGYGRIKIIRIHGRTKKDKIRIDIGFLK